MPEPTRLFVSYPHTRKKYKDELCEALSPLTRSGVALWVDHRLYPGADTHRGIMKALSVSDGAILLVCREFLSSDFIDHKELGYSLLRRTAMSDFLFIPVMLDHCAVRLDARFLNLSVVFEGRPIHASPKRDKHWADLAYTISNLVAQQTEERAKESALRPRHIFAKLDLADGEAAPLLRHGGATSIENPASDVTVEYHPRDHDYAWLIELALNRRGKRVSMSMKEATRSPGSPARVVDVTASGMGQERKSFTTEELWQRFGQTLTYPPVRNEIESQLSALGGEICEDLRVED